MASRLSNQNKNNDNESTINHERSPDALTTMNGSHVKGNTGTKTFRDYRDPAVSDSDDSDFESSSQPSDDASFSRRPVCKNGLRCFNPSCSFKHPPGWNACDDGRDCDDYDCPATHPYNRIRKCRDGRRCKRRKCDFLHPVLRANACPAKDACQIWNCEKWHSKRRPKNCPFGKSCYNTVCKCLHPSDRQPCPNGVECRDFDCQLDHQPGRAILCEQSNECPNFFCTSLHPTDWNPCDGGSECKDPNCPHINHSFDRALHLDDKANDENRQLHTRPSLKSLEQRQIEREQAQLPILAVKNEFCRRLETERIIVVTAETGSGKSTQLPQYAAEYFGGLVVCTQPRVIAAISLARRVANEYDGMSVGQSVGYRVGHSSIGKDRNRVPGTDILFMTDGTFIQESQIDSQLSDIRVLIIDEAHERSLNTDIVIGIAKRLLTIRPTDFYVVISSATINTGKFLQYFEQTETQLLKVPGRVYDVSVDYKPKSKEPIEKHAVNILQNIYDQHQGHTLVFLPGQREIENAMELFKRKIPDHCFALPLYAALSPEEQDLVLQFDEGEQNENRMVVFCTNIAETSLTIKNVRLVIDSGLVNESYFDHDNRVTVVESVKISRASAEQRRGRAGRTAPGHCVHLYEEEDLINTDTKPQILRSSLDLVVLQLTRLKLNAQEFPFMDRPDEKHIQTSLDLLKDLACIDTNYDITPRGELFGKLGIDPRYSAFLFDTYLEHDPILELAATITAILVAPGSVFSFTGETKEEKESGRDRIANNAHKFDSDLFYFFSVYKDWSSAGAIDPDKRICMTCRKPYKNSYACGPCRAAYSRTHLLNNKTLNYIESMSDELMMTIQDPRWQLVPSSLEHANESVIIGINLLKYFPERHGRLIVSRRAKEDARMIKSGFRTRISDTSALFQRQTDNPFFIAMSMVKLPGGTYVIDRLHPFSSPSQTCEDEEASDN